jgi:hypothetical protein
MKPKSGTKYFIRKQFHQVLKDGTVVYYDVKVRYELPKSKKIEKSITKNTIKESNVFK